MSKIISMVLGLLLITGTCFAGEITVSAAMSLKDAVGEIKAIFEKEQPGTKVNCNFASSGVLRRQIESRAPVDIFASANRKHMAALVEKGLIDSNSVKVFAHNSLVLIVPNNTRGKIKGWNDLTKAERLSIGHPGHVPAGIYAKEVLCNLGLWDRLEPKMVYANHVRQVLEYVAQGMVDAGVVYKTEVSIANGRVKSAAVAPPHTSTPITYPVGVVSFSKNKGEARKFENFLLGEKSKAILKKYGFESVKNPID